MYIYIYIYLISLMCVCVCVCACVCVRGCVCVCVCVYTRLIAGGPALSRKIASFMAPGTVSCHHLIADNPCPSTSAIAGTTNSRTTTCIVFCQRIRVCIYTHASTTHSCVHIHTCQHKQEDDHDSQRLARKGLGIRA